MALDLVFGYSLAVIRNLWIWFSSKLTTKTFTHSPKPISTHLNLVQVLMDDLYYPDDKIKHTDGRRQEAEEEQDDKRQPSDTSDQEESDDDEYRSLEEKD